MCPVTHPQNAVSAFHKQGDLGILLYKRFASTDGCLHSGVT